jgi:predicted ATP-grasp superfamily ATP-dependent carboligase
MKSVLVLDANQRSALAVIRSLGRRGIRVIAADHTRRTLGASSRYAKSTAQYSDPRSDASGFRRAVAEAVVRHNIDLVIPVTDITTMLLVQDPGLVLPATLAAPRAESYEHLTDKRRLVSLANELEIPTPETRVAANRAEVLAACQDQDFPLVLKPSRSRYLKGNCIHSTAVTIVRSREHLHSVVNGMDWLDDIPCLVQKYIEGTGSGVFAISHQGESVAWFSHRRIREKPPSGGVSVLCESIPVMEKMKFHAARLLDASRWSGVAMVEFRITAEGVPYLMEVNGRLWGSLQLPVDCGIDFPWLLYQLFTGGEPDKVEAYIVGRRMQWLLGDFDHLLIQLRKSSLSTHAKWRVVTRFLASVIDVRCRNEIFRCSDPGPAFIELRQWFGALVDGSRT